MAIWDFIERLAIRPESPLFGASRFARFAIRTTLEGEGQAKAGRGRGRVGEVQSQRGGKAVGGRSPVVGRRGGRKAPDDVGPAGEVRRGRG